MNAVRIGILAVAALAAIAVAFFVRQAMSNDTPVVAPVEERPAVRVLAARRDIAIGERVNASDFYWQNWPEEAITRGYIIEGRGQDSSDFAGSVVRAEIREGEPITGRRLVQQGDAGFMAAVLSPGMRAVAVPISAERGAGGFILPNDRVDVIVSFEADGDGARGGSAYVAEMIIENARVLAIDQVFGERDGEESVVGETATLELTPDQARSIAVAVVRGEVTLALRSLSENDTDLVLGGELDASSSVRSLGEDNSVTVIRYGRSSQVALAGDE